MQIRDEVFERFKNGEVLAQFRNEYRSSSQVVEGCRMYLDWLEQETEEKRAIFLYLKEENEKGTTLNDQLSSEKRAQGDWGSYFSLL